MALQGRRSLCPRASPAGASALGSGNFWSHENKNAPWVFTSPSLGPCYLQLKEPPLTLAEKGALSDLVTADPVWKQDRGSKRKHSKCRLNGLLAALESQDLTPLPSRPFQPRPSQEPWKRGPSAYKSLVPGCPVSGAQSRSLS